MKKIIIITSGKRYGRRYYKKRTYRGRGKKRY